MSLTTCLPICSFWAPGDGVEFSVIELANVRLVHDGSPLFERRDIVPHRGCVVENGAPGCYLENRCEPDVTRRTFAAFVMPALVARLSGSILMDRVHGVDSSAF